LYWNNNTSTWDADSNKIHIGENAGQNTQQDNAIAIGSEAGKNTQKDSAIAIGKESGFDNQGFFSIAIGRSSGNINQSDNSIAIGLFAGSQSQETQSIAIGLNTAQTGQGQQSVGIGSNTAQITQGQRSVAIGSSAGRYTQGQQAIAIGFSAGEDNQGQNAIAIGSFAGMTAQPANSIVLNATGTTLNGDNTSSFYVAPIRSSSNTLSTLMYDTTNKEIVYSESAKTFVIDHPTNKDKLLVHACLEGPEAGVYYRGESEITNDESIEIELPNYVDKICTDLTIQLTLIYNGDKSNTTLYTSPVKDNKFTVYASKNVKFYWLVHGKRSSITVEPLRENVDVKGNGPYKWI
jgi:hypothetical protein